MHQTKAIHQWWCLVAHVARIAVSETLRTNIFVWKDISKLVNSSNSPYDAVSHLCSGPYMPSVAPDTPCSNARVDFAGPV